MSDGETARLRGFDSYRVSLGDEMRGERASLGKSLLDVQRDLKIKAAHIDALENARPQDLPHRGFVTAYLRAYARYLGMDEADVLRRFCEESGFELSGGAAPSHAPAGRSRGLRTSRREDLDAVIAGSRLAAVSRAEAMSGRFETTVRGLGSLAALAAMVWGVGFGGWAILQNIQRVQLAPSPDAPEALAEGPELGAITRIVRAGAGPMPPVDAAALAAVYAAQEVAPPRLATRDGPIVAIRPPVAQADRFARREAEADALAARFGTRDAPIDDLAALDAAPPPPADAPASPPARAGVALVFAEEAWVRVRDGAGATVHERLMRAGARWDAPEGAEGLTLRAGNAGGVLVEVDGVLYGPVGAPGAVVPRVDLSPEAVRSALPVATQTQASAAPIVASSLDASAPRTP